MQTLPSIEASWHDLRHALRALRKSPGFAAVSIATLGLGIGAATAIFSVIDNVLLEPFPEKGRGTHGISADPRHPAKPRPGRQGYTATEILEFAENNHVFDGITAATGEPVLYKRGEGTERFSGAHVTPGTFQFSGCRHYTGECCSRASYEPGSPPVFVMRYKAWMERFGGDLSVLNRTFVLNGTPRTLVGIIDAAFCVVRSGRVHPRDVET